MIKKYRLDFLIMCLQRDTFVLSADVSGNKMLLVTNC